MCWMDNKANALVSMRSTGRRESCRSRPYLVRLRVGSSLTSGLGPYMQMAAAGLRRVGYRDAPSIKQFDLRVNLLNNRVHKPFPGDSCLISASHPCLKYVLHTLKLCTCARRCIQGDKDQSFRVNVACSAVFPIPTFSVRDKAGLPSRVLGRTFFWRDAGAIIRSVLL